MQRAIRAGELIDPAGSTDVETFHPDPFCFGKRHNRSYRPNELQFVVDLNFTQLSGIILINKLKLIGLCSSHGPKRLVRIEVQRAIRAGEPIDPAGSTDVEGYSVLESL